jgi:xanthine dehydrogenase accessory factor
MRLDILKSLNAERAARRAAVIVTDIATGAQRFVAAADIEADPLRDILHSRLRNGKSGMEETPQGRVFLTVHVPPPRLVVTGAVHISQALAPVAGLLGYDVTIVDPRTAFASPERFPDVKLIPQWPDEALPPLGIDRYTAFAALTHDQKIDDPALLHALSRDCFYIGALGSKKTHARRLERLKAQGATEGALARIHAPIGLAIGAVSPGEIAIAIMAEITASLRLTAAASLSSPSGRGQMSPSGPHPDPSLGESRVEAGA